ncbi:MAG: hypothetical protein HRU19_28960 [Pseudobacteriovorax sp.]|nr:hypothetical protein [Pseudobacteriovorax sp.]
MDKTEVITEVSDVKKISLNIKIDLLEQLKRFASQKGLSNTSAVNQAISDFLYFRDQHRSGNKVLIEDKNGDRKEIVFR